MARESAFDAYSVLDGVRPAWDMRNMNQRVRLFFVLLSVVTGASMACRERTPDTGVGGQSGDEGRRPAWLGHGGAGARTPEAAPPPRR
jgi:hypothetical protein